MLLFTLKDMQTLGWITPRGVEVDESKIDSIEVHRPLRLLEKSKVFMGWRAFIGGLSRVLAPYNPP